MSWLLVTGGYQGGPWWPVQGSDGGTAWGGTLPRLFARLHAANIEPLAVLDTGDSLIGSAVSWALGGHPVAETFAALGPTLHLPGFDLLLGQGPAATPCLEEDGVAGAMLPVLGGPTLGALWTTPPIVSGLRSSRPWSAQVSWATCPTVAAYVAAAAELRRRGAELVALVARAPLAVPELLAEVAGADIVLIPSGTAYNCEVRQVGAGRYVIRFPAGRHFAAVVPLKARRLVDGGRCLPDPASTSLPVPHHADEVLARLFDAARDCWAEATVQERVDSNEQAQNVMCNFGADVLLWLPFRPPEELGVSALDLTSGPAARVTIEDLSGADLVDRLSDVEASITPLLPSLPASLRVHAAQDDGGVCTQMRAESAARSAWLRPTARYRLVSWGLPAPRPFGSELAALPGRCARGEWQA